MTDRVNTITDDGKKGIVDRADVFVSMDPGSDNYLMNSGNESEDSDDAVRTDASQPVTSDDDGTANTGMCVSGGWIIVEKKKRKGSKEREISPKGQSAVERLFNCKVDLSCGWVPTTTISLQMRS
jgi:hypothetical protein